MGSYSKKFPHPWGLTDVHGNVGEWCADWYDAGYYARSPKDNPVCRDGEQKLHVSRGGSWGSAAKDCRAAFRDECESSASIYRFCSFRVVFCPD